MYHTCACGSHAIHGIDILPFRLDNIIVLYKYKKQLKKYIGIVGLKSIQTRVVGIITDEMHPYTFLIMCRDASHLLLSLLLLFVHFLALPSSLLEFI